MKRTVIILLALTILLAGCVSAMPTPTDPAANTSPSAPTDNTTVPTETDPPATTEPVTQPTETEPPETELTPTLSGDLLSLEQLNEYQINLDTNNVWNCATTTVFSDPSQINLGLLFYNGIMDGIHELTDEELAHFVAIEETLQYVGVHVLPPDEMNQTLIEHFGITLEETDKRGLDQLAYWEETGNYYWFGTDANGNWDIEVIAGSTLPDGTIQILYRSASAGRDAEAKNESNLWIMTFTPEGTIFSNLPA